MNETPRRSDSSVRDQYVYSNDTPASNGSGQTVPREFSSDDRRSDSLSRKTPPISSGDQLKHVSYSKYAKKKSDILHLLREKETLEKKVLELGRSMKDEWRKRTEKI